MQGKEFEVPVCLSCSEHLTSLSMNQTIANIRSLLCHHAKVATNIIRDFNNPMALDGWLNLEEDEDDEDNTTVALIHKKEGKSTKTQHLAVVFIKAKNKHLFFLLWENKQHPHVPLARLLIVIVSEHGKENLRRKMTH